MRLQPRLALSHAIVIFLAICAFPLALYAIRHLATITGSMIQEHLNTIAVVNQLREDLGSEYVLILEMVLAPNPEIKDKLLAIDHNLYETVQKAQQSFTNPDEKIALDSFLQHYIHLQNSMAIWQKGQMNPKNLSKLPETFEATRVALLKINDLQMQSVLQTAKQADDFARKLFVILAALGLLLFIFGLLTVLRLVHTVTRQVRLLTALAQRMSTGDFNIAFQRGSIDEFNVLGHHFEMMGRTLRAFRASNLGQLVAEQRRITAVINSIDDGLVIFAESGAIERINPVAERQLNLSALNAIGHRFEEVSGNREIGLRILEVLNGQEPAVAILPELIVERAGQKRILAYSLRRFDESHSVRSGAVLVLRDVTVERAFDKMRSDFVLRASHELRTPVTSIRMGLGLLAEKLVLAPDSREVELYDMVQQEVQRMVSLLTDLLDLSRLQAGQHALERLPTDIGELLSRAQQRFNMSATQSGIALDLDLDLGLPFAALDRAQFDRVLDNLIVNALRHTPSGGSITLTARTISKGIAISVTDTGEGIPHAQHSLIFQPFVQVGSRRGGAGLGLAICKEIVQQHDGEIQMSSLPGRGTTFTLLLPT